MKELETDFISIESDESIYTKVPDVIFALKIKVEDAFPAIFLCKGGFDIGMSCYIESTDYSKDVV